MANLTKLQIISIDEYLEGEQTSEVRHEYINGEAFAIVGASAIHNLIAQSLSSLMHSHLSQSTCNVFQSDMKVRVNNAFSSD